VRWPLEELQAAAKKSRKETKSLIDAKINEYKKEYMCACCDMFIWHKPTKVTPLGNN